MPDKKTHRPGRQGLLDQIRQLEATVRKLKEGAPQTGAKTDGLAEGIVTALGKMVPGLGKLIETASQRPEFHEKLAGIDDEVRRKFKDQPMGRATLGLTGGIGRRQIGIPPAVRRAGAGHPAAGGQGGPGFAKAAPRGKYRTPQPPKVHISPETPAQLHADVFDEGDKIVVLAEAPGLEAKDIAVSLDGCTLVLAILAPGRRGTQKIELPGESRGEPDVSLANGILNIHIQKANRS